MGIVNRRNALVGWLALKVGKRLARRKARQVRGSIPFWRRTRD
jgi:hypothetical protein